MILLFGGCIMLVVTNVLGQHGHAHHGYGHNGYGHNGHGQNGHGQGGHLPPILPNTYKDVFLAGLSGKPTLGTAGSTCWARGGICVDLRQCPSLKMDVGVAGCSWGYKVCCKVHSELSPTVGVLRRFDVPVINDLNEIAAPLEVIAIKNTLMMGNWQTEVDDVRLDDLME